jgi:hypothetical protein
MVNCAHQARPATGRAAPGGDERVDAKALKKLLRVSLATARRRFVEWFEAPAGTAPAVTLTTAPGRRGRSAYTTTRAELARHLPELVDP